MLPDKDRKMPVALNFLDLAEPRLADNLKHNGETLVKFIGVVADFLQKSAAIYEQHGEELRSLVLQGRQQVDKLKQDGDFLIPSLLKTWDQMLNYTAITSDENIEMANKLSSDISIRLLNTTGHRKVQTQKLFEERSALESTVGQAEDQLYQAQKSYIEAYGNFMLSNGNKAAEESQTKTRYLNSHNTYVLQLHRYNSIMEDYQTNVLPQWFQEVDSVCTDVYSALCASLIDLNQRQGIKAVHESKRCEELIQMAKQVDSKTDLILFARGQDSVGSPLGGRGKRLEFQPPAHSAQDGPKDEIVVDVNTSKVTRSTMDSLLADESNLEAQLKRQYQTLNDLLATQQKQLEMHLYSRVASIQEEISDVRKAIRLTKIRLSGLHGQLCILDCRYASRRASVNYLTPTELLPEPVMNPAGMKTRWRKAFFNLKRNGTLKREHEKLPADYSGSGNAATGSRTSSTQKSPKVKRNVFRTAMSSSELNVNGLKLNSSSSADKSAANNAAAIDVDPIYLLLKQGGALNPRQKGGDTDSGLGSGSLTTSDRRPSRDSVVAGSSRHVMDRRNSSMSEPESVEATTRTRGPMLNTRMKSISLDSPDQEVVMQGRPGRPVLERGQSTVGPLPKTASPGNKRRILQMKGRGKSLDLGDGPGEVKSPETTAAPAQNVFVALQSYRCKGPDELELRPGDRVVVVDSSKPDWWRGKCFSATGHFPSECVARVNPGERVCVVSHSLQLNENGTVLRLSKNDIVMTTGPDEAGMVPIRCGGKRACCPLKYLQVLDYFEI
ncbi:hypothetical protein RvY_00233 [Ramazzottius varieornatus]|uniref:SH3 domain-containing protein n=1 Tax=Ramazzottius varieornatus TaxID=947166 RepID=A0A1D1UMI8_RAMVA|nr:hypothetical protein RvY_00233 [Ramazzottius varieornatus]